MNFAYPRNVRFTCSRCAICCGDTGKKTRHILMMKNEAELISKTASRKTAEFAEKITHHQPYVFEMRKDKEGKCLFLKGRECAIYEFRPLVCRFYPFELAQRKDGKPEFRSTDECPSLGSGELLTKRFFEDLIAAINKKTVETL